MTVLHINTNDKGGAANACIRIHEELLRQGVKSRMLFLNKSKDNIPHAHYFNKKLSFFRRVELKLKSIFFKNIDIRTTYDVEWFSFPKTNYDITTHFLYKEADIIQLNWVSGFLDEPSFFKKNVKPVVWRMPDLYCCGAGYHYEKNFPTERLRTVLNKNFAIRKKVFKKANIHFVAISNWVYQKAQESELINSFPKSIIHNGLDLSKFKPVEKVEARKLLNLPQDKTILLLGADQINTKRKGFFDALEAIDMLEHKGLQPVVFGKTKTSLSSQIINLGYIDSLDKLIQIYSASDVFLMPSIEEAFGQVTIEALSCGIPVVSYPNGGSLDIIRNGQNGEIANDFSVKALSTALRKALYTNYDSEVIIEDIKIRFDIKDKVKEYIEVYNNFQK
ncbi:glycosyltransferase family 4 protein [Urechidicola sp. KH5]